MRNFFFSFLLISAVSLQSFLFSREFVFTDFPLLKVDYMYREQGGPVAHLVFQLWFCTRNFLQQETIRKDHYYDQAAPLFKKLSTFKRFIDELSIEWMHKYGKDGIRTFFRHVFSKGGAQSHLEALSDQAFLELLFNLQIFLEDIARNTPYARKKCVQFLSAEHYEPFCQFTATELVGE